MLKRSSPSPKRRRRHSTRLIKDNYSYHVEQIADLFRVEVSTIRRWVREEGLERIPNTRPHLIHSSKLKAFIQKQQAKRKKPCAENEAFCLRCQSPRIPLTGSGVAVPLPNGCIRFKAKCGECRGKINQNIKAAHWHKNHPLAVFLTDATREHKGVQSTHRECSLHMEEESCLNITH